MEEKNGICTFRTEGENYSQRNNELVWPTEAEKPKAQYRTSWKNMCNVTAYVDALERAGYNFPDGEYNQPEDNLAYFILTSQAVRTKYEKECPAMYKSFIRSLDGLCSERELNNMYFPNELHDYLSFGASKWIGTQVSSFSTNCNFKKALWKYMVMDNLPIVISTVFGGFNHIVCCIGVQYSKSNYESGKKYLDENNALPDITPESIIVDDPWGKYNPKTNKYDATNQGGGIIVPWDKVVENVKPVNSPNVKWMHTFYHGIATV